MTFHERGSIKKSIINVLLLCLISNLIMPFAVQSIQAVPNTILVPDDYASISKAVENANPFDTLFVKNGIYYENIFVDKPLLIQGEDQENTIIIGTSNLNDGNVLTLASNNITIRGLTIRSSKHSSSNQYANGINIKGDNCTIIGNKIKDTFWGILCAIQSSTIITQNKISNNLKEGVRFYGGSYNTISENYIFSNKASGIALEGYSNLIVSNHIENNTRGIGLGASYSTVFGNVISDHTESGFYFSGSNNTISSNEIINSKYGVYFPSDFAAPNGNRFYHNNFINNIQNVYVSSEHNLNYWNTTSEGNHWSNFESEYPTAKEVETSRTADIPYFIHTNNVDNHPLIQPFDIESSKIIPKVAQPKLVEGSIVAFWKFEEVSPNHVTVDAVGINNAILGSTSNNINYTPSLIPGKFGNCLSFDGWAYVYVPASPTLEIQNEITIEAWIYIKEFKHVAYNNIIIQSTREDRSYPKRIMGLAVNGLEPENNTSPPVGALRGYVVTKTEEFNEIATKESTINLNEWTKIMFVRDLKSGMELYVNEEKKDTYVTAGIQNPQGNIKRSTYLYIGHDSKALIDEIIISNIAGKNSEFTYLEQLWPFIISILAVIIFGLVLFIIKKISIFNNSIKEKKNEEDIFNIKINNSITSIIF